MGPKLALYVRDWCPYCSKVKHAMKAMGLEIPLRDLSESHHREALLNGGGKTQVPCLRIDHPGGKVEWMYESDDIIDYLQTRVTLSRPA